MTTVRWTEPANSDFLGIVKWLKNRNPAAAARIGRAILDAVERLADHPNIGRPGRSPDTRELSLSHFPYVIVYNVDAGSTASDPPPVIVLRVLHAAMLWPRPAGQ